MYSELIELVEKSLVISPNNKTSALRVDDLPKQSGYIQYGIIKNLESASVDVSGRKSSVVMTDEIVNIYKTHEEKTTQLKALHAEGQEVMRRLCDNMEKLVHENPTAHQAKLCRIAGLDIPNDRNWTGATILSILCKSGRIERYKDGRQTKFRLLENGSPFKPVPYIDPRLGASKLEARFAILLMEHGLAFEQQVRLPDLKHKTYLPIDFKVILEDETEIYVEIDGKQHYTYIQHFHRTPEGFELQQKRDRIKDEYMADNELYFVRIRYDEDQWKVFHTYMNQVHDG